MGIRFTCPNGHQLNVKASQAGKTGKCPRCGATVAIPQASESAGEASPGDPFADAPGAAWYIHLSGVERHGPISADVMRTWLAQGRVPGDALVWREGWSEWAVASKVLPMGTGGKGGEGDNPLFAGAKTGTVPGANMGAGPGEDIGVVPAPASDFHIEPKRPARAVRPARPRSRSRSTLVVGVLTALVLLLGLVFLWVLTK
ncbi:MAG: DUF4339 domain-containing protein [Pirellulales bacterium]|nr:DUF4339 domain-containing protein [Pirellulales bacterium]